MTPKPTLTAAVLAVGLLVAGPVSTHTPLFSCFDNYDGTIFCEGGFSDGSSAAGVKIEVLVAGQAVLSTELDADGILETGKPEGDYTVRFDAGPGHVIDVAGGEIE